MLERLLQILPREWAHAALALSVIFFVGCGGGSSGLDTPTPAPPVPVPLPAEAPTIALDIAPDTVPPSATASLTWSSTNASACAASGGWSGEKGVNGAESTGPLLAETAYMLTCSGAGGTAAKTVIAGVAPPGGPQPPLVTLTAVPSTVASGSSATLTWSSSNATACTAAGNWTGSKPISGSASTGALTSNSSFALTCTGPGGSATQSANVTVTSATAPSVTLTAAPTTVTRGGSATLTWSSSNATSCTASGGWSGTKVVSGSEPRSGLTANSTFTLTCTGAGGAATQSVSVTVTPPAAPTITLTATPTTVTSGGSTSLNWTTANANACTASGGWSGTRPLNGSEARGGLTGTTTFTLACTGAGGSATQSVTVTVTPSGGPPPPNVALSAVPTTVAYGNSTTLNWSSNNASSCTASGGWSGSRPTSGSAASGALTANSSFTLTCTGAGGSANQSVTVTVTPPPAPSVMLSAAPPTVASGGSSTLSWSSSNATSCTASGAWTGAKATSGSETRTSLTANSTFTLTCTGGGGSAVQSVIVTVTPSSPPTVALTATPTTVASGGSSTLSWSSTNATGCTASGGWTGSKPLSGAEARTNLTQTASYTLSCSGAGGTASQTVTVNVTPALPAPTLLLTATPSAVVQGNAATLNWTSSNATSCTASGDWTGGKVLSGSQSTGTLSAVRNHSYTLSCSGAGGSVSQTANVTVGSLPAPTVTLSANPAQVAQGGTSVLTWSSQNATSCTASGGWSGAKNPSGTEQTAALAQSTTFSLACTGLGGTGNASTTVTVGGGQPTFPQATFPLRQEAGKRYLVDAAGKPFLMNGESAWGLMTKLTREQVVQYLDDRRAKGINTIMVMLVSHHEHIGPSTNVYGQAPFTTVNDFATPNEQYFTHADWVLTRASERGMLVLLAPLYAGYGGTSAQGFWPAMQAAGTAKLQAYGQYVGKRYRGYNNILWVQGGDFTPTNETGKNLVRAIANGIRAEIPNVLQTFHGGRFTNAMAYWGTGEPWLTVNNIYTDQNVVVQYAFQEYARTTVPFFLIEAHYENEHGVNERILRSQAYQALLSGASGHVMGIWPMWAFASNWQAALNSRGSVTLPHMRGLFEARSWWTLQPDTTGQLMTGGAESGVNRAVAATATDRSFAVSYMPTIRTLTLNLAQLAGPRVNARWCDPANGVCTPVTGSPFNASGSQTFRPAANNSSNYGDWTLVLESTP
jgi:hypothetical protein